MKDDPKKIAELKKKLSDQKWRLNNLYYIIDKTGKRVKFKLNWAQEYLLDHLWYFNIILKVRQLGISTFISLFFLDCCLFKSNQTAGQICDTLANAKNFLRDKTKYAYDNLPDWLKERRQITKFSLSADDAGIWFSNGSSIRVGTSFRSGTLTHLHVSELAKICKKRPEQAAEIRTGALNTIQSGQIVFIESTGEGGEGDFYDISTKAEAKQKAGEKLSKLDFRFFFFSWWEQPEYSLEIPKDFVFSTESSNYFKDLLARGIKLTNDQKYWYVKKKEILGTDVRKEYPSFSEEAFSATSEGKYYARLIAESRAQNRVSEFAVDPLLEVHTVWDLGIGKDAMTIWFFQIFGREVRIVDYYENHGEGFSHYYRIMAEKNYSYGKHYAPFDIAVRELSGQTRIEVAEQAGIYFERTVDSSGNVHSALPKISLEDGVDGVRRLIPNCHFKKSTTERGLECLEKYSRKWNESIGQWGDQRKDEYEQGASSFRYLAQAVDLLSAPEYDDEDLNRASAEWMEDLQLAEETA